MPSRSLTPIKVFESNIADAQALLALTRGLSNSRQRRMRAELRESVGNVLHLAKPRRAQLDCVESQDVFLVLKPGCKLRRHDFDEVSLRPMLRQAVVAIAAAVESYAAEKACRFVRAALQSSSRPARMNAIALTFGDAMEIERTYRRRGWGWRRHVEKWIERETARVQTRLGLSSPPWERSWSGGRLTKGDL